MVPLLFLCLECFLPVAWASSLGTNADRCSRSTAIGKRGFKVSSKLPASQLAMARSLRLCGNDTEAIVIYRRYLQSHPNNPDGQVGLGEALAAQGRYQAALSRFRQVLKEQPGYYDALQGEAYVLFWEGVFSRAEAIFEGLKKRDPRDPENSQALKQIARAQAAAYWKALRPAAGAPARLWVTYYTIWLASYPNDRAAMDGLAYQEIQLKRYHAARQELYRLLEADPGNRVARLEVAQLDIVRHQFEPALENYDILLRENPQDPVALLGKARVSFYLGEFPEAELEASEAVKERPDNFPSVFLLASIEHARHHHRETLRLLNHAGKLSPGNAQVASLRRRVLSESRVTLSTTVAYGREIGPPTESNGHGGLANEDLRTYTYATTIGINLLPRTNSYFTFASVPTDSPPGPERDSLGNQIPTGITGATAPYEFLYRQSTRFNRRFTLRAGAGSVRFGPGDLVSLPWENSPIKSAEECPIGLAGVSFRLTHYLSVDVDATRSAITYTPVSTRLGVVEDRLQGRINLFFNSRTQLHWAYWYGYYSSEDYAHTAIVNGTIESDIRADHDQSRGESITFERSVLHTERISLDAGYKGLIYGVAPRQQDVYLGFFNPNFYQRHEFVPRIQGPLWGPVGYDVSAGIGIQQVGHGEAITRAWNASPNISVRINRHLHLILGYVHYNTAQVLGPLRGNEVRFDTEWHY